MSLLHSWRVKLCFLSSGFPKTLYEVLSILKLSLLALNHLLSEAKLLFALAITSSSDFPCTKTLVSSANNFIEQSDVQF